MKIKKLLHGCRAGRIQSVGNMQVIPLLSDVSFGNFASPAMLKVNTRAGYGNMEFENKDSDKDAIIPMHTAYIIDLAAQNHAMTHAGVVKKSQTKMYKSAACIQAGQGGTIPTGNYDFVILPYSLREIALNKRGQESYSKLWEDISAFNKQFNLPTQGHLEHFFKHFQKQLAEFVAEFEPVPTQVGAIILINGKIVGIEKTPSNEYFESVWESLIRGCYGAISMLAANQKEKVEPFAKPIDIEDLSDVEDLLVRLKQSQESEQEFVNLTVNELLEQEVSLSASEEKVGSLEVHTVENEKYVGQLVSDADAVAYASLICKAKYLKNRKYHDAGEFQMS